MRTASDQLVSDQALDAIDAKVAKVELMFSEYGAGRRTNDVCR